MRALLRFDYFGVIGMTMIFTSSRFDDSLIYRADHFLRMPFLLQNFTAVSLRSLMRGRGKVISHLARYSIFKVTVKRSFTYSHWERLNEHPESQKFLIPSLIWNWEVKTQPVFQKKQKKYWKGCMSQKISLLVPTGRVCLGMVILKKGKKISSLVMAGTLSIRKINWIS